MEHFDLGKKDGATLVFGGGRITASSKNWSFSGNPEGGHFVEPTLWDGANMKMNFAQTEVFGPTVNVVRVKSFEAALEAANATQYGLSSAIFTNNPYYMHKFKNGIDAGMTSINNSTTGAEAHLPFGGTKGSGNGTRESGIWVIDAYTKWQAVNMDLSSHLQLAQIDVEEVHGGVSNAIDLKANYAPVWR
jgi:aldehyde dehydrogenase (NAD+)